MGVLRTANMYAKSYATLGNCNDFKEHSLTICCFCDSTESTSSLSHPWKLYKVVVTVVRKLKMFRDMRAGTSLSLCD